MAPNCSECPKLESALRGALGEALRGLLGNRWKGVKEQAERLGVGERSVRDWISFGVDPLPSSRVSDGGKILINDLEADEWLRKRRSHRDLDMLVTQVLKEMK